MELIIILFLIVLNGILSMSEIAIISVKKSRLKHLAQEGHPQAALALEIAENPNRFFSTVQVGITLIGILTGAIGGLVLAAPLAEVLELLRVPNTIAHTIAFSIVVALITYLSLVIGELVPKRLGMAFAERISLLVSGPMHSFSQLAYPFVEVLTNSTDTVMRMLNVRTRKKLPVSEEEVRLMINEGAQMGVFEAAEKNIVEKVLNIGDSKVTALMQARNKLIWLDINVTDKELTDTILEHQYSYFPVCNGELDKILGVIRTDSFLAHRITQGDKPLNIKKILHKPLLIPENKKVLDTLELFKRSRIHLGIIVDEYGSIEGVITLTDILESIVGELPDINEQEDTQIKKRNSTSWHVDGLVSTVDFKDFFHIDELPDEDEELYNTVGGFIMNSLERIPAEGDTIDLENYAIQVADMDGHRVDKVIVEKLKITP